MSREHASHTKIARLAQDGGNLLKKKAGTFRAQAKRLREQLETYLQGHLGFTLLLAASPRVRYCVPLTALR